MTGNRSRDRTGLRPRWRARHVRLLQLWGVGIAASLFVTGASAMGYLEFIEARALDLILRLQGQRFSTDVVIVAIDDHALESLGQRQPIPREYLARLIRAIQQSGAAVVGLDIALIAPTTPGEDDTLAKAILEFSQDGVSRVVLTDAMVGVGGPLGSPMLLRAVVRGSDRVPVDEDGLIRRASFLMPGSAHHPAPAFSLAILARLTGMNQVALEMAARAPGGLFRLPTWKSASGWTADGGPPLAFRSGELTRINFVGPAESFFAIPSGAIMPLSEPGSEIARDNPPPGSHCLGRRHVSRRPRLLPDPPWAHAWG